MQWNVEGPEMPESAGSLDMLRYSIPSVLDLPASFFRQSVN